MTASIQTTRRQSDTLDVSRSLAASLAPGRHDLSSKRLERVYGEAPMTPGSRTRIASELDFCGLVILSEPYSEPLVVAKHRETPRPAPPESASHHARRVKVLAERAANEVVRSGRPVALPAMTDEERAIVREHLRWRINLVARSEGEGPERHVVVLPI